TAAISGRSSGASASRSTIDAMISTSYGVRVFDRAYFRLTLLPFLRKASSWLFTSCAAVVWRRKSYVAGKRKPSSDRFFVPNPGTTLGPDRSEAHTSDL